MTTVRFDNTVLFIFDFSVMATDNLQPRGKGWADLFDKILRSKHQIAILHLSARAQNLHEYFQDQQISDEILTKIHIHSRMPCPNGITASIHEIAQKCNRSLLTRRTFFISTNPDYLRQAVDNHLLFVSGAILETPNDKLFYTNITSVKPEKLINYLKNVNRKMTKAPSDFFDTETVLSLFEEQEEKIPDNTPQKESGSCKGCVLL